MSAGIRLACFSGEVLNVYRRRGDCVLRRTEQILFPEENADIGAGFGVVEVSPLETWVMTSEIPTKGSRDYNRVLMARLVWSQPNRLFGQRP